MVSSLTSEDYTRLLTFSKRINKNYNNFINNTLNALSDLFNFNLTVYTIFNKQSNDLFVSYITGYNISKESLAQYKNYYYQTDIFCKYSFKKFHSNKVYNTVLLISDFMNYSQFKNSEYGKFLKNLNIDYQAAMCSTNYPKHCINIFRTYDEGDFLDKEVELLNHISDIFKESVVLYNQYMMLNNIIELTDKFTETLDYGFSIINSKNMILKHNTIFLKYASQITHQLNISSLTTHLIKIIEEKIQMPLTQVTHPIITKIEDYQIKITPDTIANNEYIYQYFFIRIYNEAEHFIPSNNTTSPNFNRLFSEYNLTKRETEVLDLMLQGFSNQDIAHKLFISIYTVKTHIKNIFKKLNVSDRTSAIVKVQSHF